MIRADVNQSLLKGGQHLSRAFVLNVLRETSKVLRLKSEQRVSIAFVSPRVMKSLNRAYSGKDRLTDVLSFNLEGPVVGEIVVCYEQAKSQAEGRGASVRDEIALLLVHGLLHIFGHDHATRHQEQAMFALQKRILKRLGVSSV